MTKLESQKRPLKTFLFDLGNVILRFDFTSAFRRLAKASGRSAAEVERYFSASGLEVLYDGGKITTLQFHREVKGALKHSLDLAAFKSIWNEIFTPNTEVISLVKRLSASYRLVLLSNTNQMHYEYIRRRYRVLDPFDRIVLSYKEKIRKPDLELYRRAIRVCKAKPSEIFYIDDRAEMTEAAATLGIQTFTFRQNPKQLIKELKRRAVKL